MGDAGVRVDAGVRTDGGLRVDSGVRTDAATTVDAPTAEFDVPTELDVTSPNTTDAGAVADARIDARSGDGGTGANMTGGCGCRVGGPTVETPTNSHAKIWSMLVLGIAALCSRDRRRSARG